MCAVTQVVGMLVLMGIAIWDIRYRRMPVWLLVLLSVGVILCRLLLQNVPAAEMAAGIAVGAGFILLSKVTGEAFGYGDSILIMLLGIFLGVWKLFALLILAFSLAALFAAGGLVIGKFSRKITFPFIPFLAVSYAGVLFLMS